MDIKLQAGDTISNVEKLDCITTLKPLIKITDQNGQEIFARINEWGVDYCCILEVDKNSKIGTIKVIAVDHKRKGIRLSVSQAYHDDFFEKPYSI